MVYIRAKGKFPNYGDPQSMFTVHYYDEKGDLTIRSGGSRAWRCNNPGNLLRGPYSMGKSRRAIGFAGDSTDEYAVYPDYVTGHEALIVMLQGSKYFHLTLENASKRYVKKDPDHIHKIIKLTKNRLTADRTIKSLTKEEFEIYWKAIEENEGWEVGEEEPIPRWIISGVHKKKGAITEYLIVKEKGSFWVSKADAIQLALEERIHATVVHLKNGTVYLRPEYGLKPFELIT